MLYNAKVTRTLAVLGEALAQDPAAIVADFVRRYRTSPVRIPTAVEQAEIERMVEPLLESFENTLAPRIRADGRRGKPTTELYPGHPETKEIEKAAGFIGARLGADETSGFDVAALFTALRDTLLAIAAPDSQSSIASFFEWLVFVALDALAEARVRGVRERVREDLEGGTPVVMVAPELPAVLLVAEPDGLALDSIFGRLTLAVVRVGAKAIVIDASGLKNPCRAGVLGALERLFTHRKISGHLTCVVCGLGDDSQVNAWRDLSLASGVPFEVVTGFQDAVARGLALCGMRLVREN